MFHRTKDVLEEQAAVAPELLPVPTERGEFIILTDTHIPYHDPEVILKAIKAARVLNIRNLVVAGDLLHCDTISRYENAGKMPAITAEMVSAAAVLTELRKYFDQITIIVGNHDQRIEKLFAKAKNTESNAMRLMAAVMGKEFEAEDIAYGVIDHFLSSDKVTIHRLPDLILNDEWLVLHPGSCSRAASTTERKLADKHLKHVIGGHNHLVGYSTSSSGKHIAANIGHACLNEKFRYQREKPSTFPKTVPGFCAIITDEEAPNGRIIPLMVHPAWMDLEHLWRRFERGRVGKQL